MSTILQPFILPFFVVIYNKRQVESISTKRECYVSYSFFLFCLFSQIFSYKIYNYISHLLYPSEALEFNDFFYEVC